jgi:uncharacterized protein YqhQ
MSSGGHISAMQTSIKNNDRRKNKIKPFKNFVPKYLKGKALFSKKLSFTEKKELLIKLKNDRELENKQKIYKLIISFGLTIIIIVGIVFIIKFTFF